MQESVLHHHAENVLTLPTHGTVIGYLHYGCLLINHSEIGPVSLCVGLFVSEIDFPDKLSPLLPCPASDERAVSEMPGNNFPSQIAWVVVRNDFPIDNQ